MGSADGRDFGRVFNAPAIPQAPTFVGSTKSDRRAFMRNYQKYLDRTADLKSSIARKEGDIAAIKRELAKLPP